jgi:iron complex outermembrane receptor protein
MKNSAAMPVIPVLAMSLLAGGSADAQSAAKSAETAAAGTGSTASTLMAQGEPEEVLVTARRREEAAQDVPIALTVVPAGVLQTTGTYNVGQLSQLVPTVQFFSSNPRNTAITIRGLGTSFGLTNDGLEPGVGLYIDQVYMSRPAAATFDFVDVDQVEVLRGPQGTLFGKNTTAGAINITLKTPSFEREVEAEASAGTYGFLQARASISGPLVGNILAARLSLDGTLRDGMVHDVTTGKDINNQNNFSSRLQFLYRPNEKFSLRISGDYNHQQAICCAQGFAGFGPTLKSPVRQYPALAAAAGYAPASLNPFERVVDTNSPAKANQIFGGLSAIADWGVGDATFTSVSAWRTWNWDPASDRDFTRLSIQTVSANPDNQNQYSEEVRVASNGSRTVDYVAGLYYFRQKIDARPTAQYGADAANWLLAGTGSPANLLDGYRADGDAHSDTKSVAAFAQATWNIGSRLHLTPGLRYTYEDKSGSFDQTASGGHPRPGNNSDTNNLNSIARNQSYAAHFTDGSVSGQANFAYNLTDDILAYVTYSRGYKSGGINLAGIPVDASGNPFVTTAVIKPENVTSYEIGLKNQFFDKRLTLNVDTFDTEVKNYQVNVVDSGPGALRGYLANIKSVRSRGFEFDSSLTVTENFSGYLSGAFTEGQYLSFPNAPCPLELIKDSTTFCDLSGRPLPGLPRWSLSGGAEFRQPLGEDTAYVGIDASYRSSTYSDASDSKYLVIKGYSLINLRAGLIMSGGWEFSAWLKNLFDQHYFQYMSAQPGNSGAVFALPGDPRTFGVTARMRL